MFLDVVVHVRPSCLHQGGNVIRCLLRASHPFDWRARSTNDFFRASSYGCWQPLSLCRTTELSFWIKPDTNFHKQSVFIPWSFPHCNQRFALLSCIIAKRYCVLCSRLHRHVSARAHLESSRDQVLHGCARRSDTTTTIRVCFKPSLLLWSVYLTKARMLQSTVNEW